MIFFGYVKPLVWANQGYKPSLLFTSSFPALDDSVWTDDLALHCHKEKKLSKIQWFWAFFAVLSHLGTLCVAPEGPFELNCVCLLLITVSSCDIYISTGHKKENTSKKHINLVVLAILGLYRNPGGAPKGYPYLFFKVSYFTTNYLLTKTNSKVFYPFIRKI